MPAAPRSITDPPEPPPEAPPGASRATPAPAPTPPVEVDLDAAEAHLSRVSAHDIVAWAADAFPAGRLALTTSFGVQAAVMLHLVTEVIPGIPVVFVDTGFHFQETHRFADELTARLKLDLRVAQPPLSAAWYRARHGEKWLTDPDGYDRDRKVEPMERALAELDPAATLAGLRRGQTDNRRGMRHVVVQGGRHKVLPILRWSTKDVYQYLKAHDLPFHPLHEKGYASVGDWHSTRPIGAGEDERAGRFNGLKQECGLHLPSTEAEAASRASSSL